MVDIKNCSKTLKDILPGNLKTFAAVIFRIFPEKLMYVVQ